MSLDDVYFFLLCFFGIGLVLTLIILAGFSVRIKRINPKKLEKAGDLIFEDGTLKVKFLIGKHTYLPNRVSRIKYFDNSDVATAAEYAICLDVRFTDGRLIRLDGQSEDAKSIIGFILTALNQKVPDFSCMPYEDGPKEQVFLFNRRR